MAKWKGLDETKKTYESKIINPVAGKMAAEIDKIKQERIDNGTETKPRAKRSRKVAKQS